MATLSQRLMRKAEDGSYVTIHLETDSGLVLRPDGTTVEAALVGAAAALRAHTHTAADVGARPSTWTPTAAEVGASPTGHKHTKSDITDFPESMPASDVYAWAKADSKPTYTASEVGAATSSHTHKLFSAGTTAPTDKGIFWIDTNSSTGGLKYHNGSSWVAVPVAYS